MNNLIERRPRLSWDSVHPAPFESIWSVCHKVIALNHISLGELRELIQKDGVTKYSWSDSNWIDFERFGSLLRIDPKRLIAGTWQAMDMNPAYKHDYRVRRCPQCWARGYHCVLFDLAWIEMCPWHRCALTCGCHGCGSTGSFTRRTINNTHVVMKRFCDKCGIIFPEYGEILEQVPFKGNEGSMIIGYCVELLEWWRTLGRRFNERDKLLSNFLWVSKIDERIDFKALAWELSYALEVMKDVDLFWTLALDSIPIRLAVLAANDMDSLGHFETKESSARTVRSEAGKYYRSLRRQIYKKFVRDHCRCCTQLRQLNRQQALALTGGEVCTVALAYLVWRMSVEGLCHLEGLHFPRKDDYEVKLMGPGSLKPLPLNEQMRWTYLAFFGLLHELGKGNGRYKIRVMASNNVYDGDLHWCYGRREQSSVGDTSDDDHKRLLVLYPDFQNRLDGLLLRCQERWKRETPLVDENQIYEDLYWGRYRQETLDQKLTIVQTRPSDFDSYHMFWHVNV